MKKLLIRFKCYRGEIKRGEKGEIISPIDIITCRNIKDAEYLSANYRNQNFSKIECISSDVITKGVSEVNKAKDVDHFNAIINKAYVAPVSDKAKIENLERKISELTKNNNDDLIKALSEQNEKLSKTIEEMNRKLDSNNSKDIDEKEDLKKQLDELGIEYDGRMGVEKLTELLNQNK